jgi:primosomal protein N' (replication factor Y)
MAAITKYTESMHYYEVAPNRIVRAGSDTFTYSSDEPLEVGQVVKVPVGKKSFNGIVMSESKKPSYEVRTVDQVLEALPLPGALIALANWMSTYYATPLATVLSTMLPAGADKKRRNIRTSRSVKSSNRTHFVLNDDQSAAVAKIENAEAGTMLLQGITGSGKTAVYIELAKRTIERGKSCIVLVPEIALTSQLVAEFTSHFEQVILTHSRQTEAERHASWREALNATDTVVAIGPRSALFLPLKAIGLIVIDESHEPSYKQEQSPRYASALVASQLAKQHKARLVLGSATPSVLDRYVAEQTGRPIVRLDKLAKSTATKPDIKLIDMTKRANFKRHRFFSNAFLQDVEQSLAENKQALVFHNRRGSTSVTLCESCGWQAGCPRCFIPMTLHADRHELRCHICNFTSTVPTSCPVDGSIDIIHKGIGTKLIEAELTKLFPNASIARFDGDTETGQNVDDRYEELRNGEIDVIIGTQVIAKGLDLPKLRSVGIVQADAGLSLPDYSSAERAFQLLAQAIGRVGRFEHETSVVVQSYQPTHPVIVAGLNQDYESFYESILKQRTLGYFPPYCFLLKLICSYKTEAAAIRNAQALAKTLQEVAPDRVKILGPTPAFYERSRDSYRWQLVVKSPKRADLLTLLDNLPPAHWQFELDPISLL